MMVGHGLNLRALAGGTLAMVASAGIAVAADPIHLTCSGKMWATEHKVFGQPLDGQSLIIDLDRETVSGSFGNFTIFRVTDSEVVFRAPFVEDGQTTGVMTGGVDRISGRLSLNASRDGGASFILVYQMDCRPAKPLF